MKHDAQQKPAFDRLPRRSGRVCVPLPGGRRLRLSVAEGVHPLDPYAGAFAAALRVRRGDRVFDMGCGAGLYGLAALARGGGTLIGSDVDPAAVACLRRNATANGFNGNVEGRVGSLFDPVRGERFDLIITSLPQLPSPARVLATRYGGADGLACLRRLAEECGDYLTPNGRLYALVTDWSDPRRVAPLFLARGFKVARRARIERPFQPAEYDRYLPGLFAYLDARARAGLARYRRDGAWCRLGVSFLEFSRRRSPGDAGTPPAEL
ncbi:MAG: methyltransferase [Planctomycetes bacterium]|nr:methyltransferase [Planctomycetota bacterium]